MNNTNKSPKWSKYKNKATGDIVVAKQHQVFPELQTVNFDSSVKKTDKVAKVVIDEVIELYETQT